MTNRLTSRTGTAARGLGPLLLLLPLFGAVVGTTVASMPASAATTACPHPATPAGIYGVVTARAPLGCSDGPAPGGTVPGGAAASLQPSYNGGNPPLLDGGGAVVGTPSTAGENTVHALFWAPSGYSFPAGYQAGVDTFLADVSAASGSAADVYALDSQYTADQLPGTPHIRYDVHVGAPVAVTDAYPSSGGCTPDTGKGEGYTACVTDAQMHTEIASVLTSQGLPVDMGDIYLVLFPPKVETCMGSRDAAGGGSCSDTAYAGYCGYHSAFPSNSSTALYADIPFPTGFSFSCLQGESPHASAALDSTLSLISHEHNETITDPLGNAWIDSVGNEVGDECAWSFGTALGGGAGAQWNQVINGDHYELQQEFSNEDYALNATNGCALTQDVPTVSLAVTTAQPAPGVPAAFDGSGSSVANVADGIVAWSWDFGDGTGPTPGPTPTHTYATAGVYSVTLTVLDTDGFTAAASRSVSVGTLVPPSFTAKSPPATATPGRSYKYTFAAAGSPTPTYALSAAPVWLSVNPATGAVSGTPPTGTTSFSYSVVAANGVSPSAKVGPFTVAVSTTSGPQASTAGYWLVGSDGGIFSFGSAGFFGSTGSLQLQRPVVGISPTADRHGYWLVASDGGVFAFGDAGFYGSLPGLGFSPAGSGGQFALAAPIVTIVPSTDDAGYFMVASDGGVFAFGDARFAGSCPGIGGCSGAGVAVMPDATGNGYWLVTATGNVYAFGDAAYLGAPPHRNATVTSAVRTPDGNGYWVLFADGKVVPFGDARNYGDPQGTLGGDTATAVFTTSDGAGYWVATASGAVDNYGDAPADGSMAGAPLNGPIVAATGW